MKYLHFLFVSLITGCVVVPPLNIPSSYEEPDSENPDQLAVVHVYAPRSLGNTIDDIEILVDEEMGDELTNGVISIKVTPGSHKINMGTIKHGFAFPYPVALLSYNKVTEPIEIYFSSGEEYYIRYKKNSQWPGGSSYPDFQLTNRKMYEIEFALFRGLQTYDALQKTYAEANCHSDSTYNHNSQLISQQDSCESESSFDFYIQALEEIDTNLFDVDIWDKALIEVDGDKGKQLSRYVELRADQLFTLNSVDVSTVSDYRQSIPKTRPGLVSGTYRSSITSDKNLESPHVVFLTQSGNKIAGVFYPDKGHRISGTMDGNLIRFVWSRLESMHDPEGSWNISSDGMKLEGDWHSGSNAAGRTPFLEGRSILTRIDKIDSVFDYYDQAEQEVDTQTYNQNLWDRALVETGADQAKSKARYIELRTNQFYSEKVGSVSDTSLYHQVTPKAPDTAGSQIDISGTYLAEITSNQDYFFGNIDDKLVFKLEQNGDRITAVNTTKNLKIGGVRKGNLIEFFVEPHRMNYRRNQFGVWEIKPDGINITGSWKVTSWGVSGQWNLRRIE